MEIFGLHIRQEIILSQTHRPLHQQSDINCQMYETIRKFIARYQSASKTSPLQMLRPSNRHVRFSTVVLQQSPTIIPHENPQ